MVVLKKIHVLSMAKIYSISMALIGLIFGIFFALISLVAGPLATQSMMFGSFGFGFIIILPIFYGALGFFAGLLTAFIYNLIAKSFGGLEVEFDKK